MMSDDKDVDQMIYFIAHQEHMQIEDGGRNRERWEWQRGEEVCTFQANPERTNSLVSSQDTSTNHVDAAKTHFCIAWQCWLFMSCGLALFAKGLRERMLVLTSVCACVLIKCMCVCCSLNTECIFAIVEFDKDSSVQERHRKHRNYLFHT